VTTNRRAKLAEEWKQTTTERGRILAYLQSRGLPENCLEDVGDEVLRFHPSRKYWETTEAGDPVLVGTFPAMVARVTDRDGAGVTLHCTYLSDEGAGKAPVASPKKIMPPSTEGGTRGASVKLQAAGSVLGLAEGIETALAVHAATGQRCWSCLSAHGLETVDLPAEVQAAHIWGDSDPVGERSALRLAETLRAKGIAVYLHLPAKAGKDWLDIYNEVGPGGLADELAEREAWNPEPSIGIRLDSVKPERVTWLWPGRLPFGKLAVLDGDPGLGKSTVALDIGARVSTGRPMPDGTGGGDPAGVVIVSAEDGLADTIVPRLLLAGADLERIVALDACPDDEGGHPFTMPEDLHWLEQAVYGIEARFVFMDPLMAFLSGNTNSHRDQDIRRVLARVHSLAENTGAAVLVIRHLNKTPGGPAVYRGGGSIGIIGAARSGLLVARDPDDESRRVLASIKSNLCLPPESLSFRLESVDGGAARVVWEGTSAHRADALLAMPGTDDERRAIDDARDFLLTVLDDGPVASSQVKTEAKSAAISDITLRRAKAALGVLSRKEGMAGGWVWSLPEGAHERPKVFTPGDRASSGNIEHLREPEPLPPTEVVTV